MIIVMLSFVVVKMVLVIWIILKLFNVVSVINGLLKWVWCNWRVCFIILIFLVIILLFIFVFLLIYWLVGKDNKVVINVVVFVVLLIFIFLNVIVLLFCL